jgi:membrane protease YdiL (CAAX protease family)
MKRFVWFAFAVEAALLPVAALIAWPFGQPLFSDLHWSGADFLLGLAATVPLFALFLCMMQSSLEPLARIRGLLAGSLRPLFASWSLLQLGLLSALAGLAEEVLFRSVIQGIVSAHFGVPAGLVVASIVFGAVHLVTGTYGIIAGIVGAYLGLLWLAGENLLVPVVTHAAYDFAALVYLVRFWRPRGETA